MRKCAGLVVVVLALSSCADTGSRRFGPSQKAEVPDIRVLLTERATSIRLLCTEGFVVEVGGLPILETSNESAVAVTAQGRTLNFAVAPGGRTAAAEGEAIMKPRGAGPLWFDHVPYAGFMRIMPGPDGELSLINVVSLEAYLEGVVPHEIGNLGPDGYDAIKTQAVAARTYAYSKIARRRSEPFDVYATIRDQVYKGRQDRTRLANSAVHDTRGRVLRFNGDMARTYYSACCGGHTSDIRVVWPHRAPADYLFGVRDSDSAAGRSFCSAYKNFRWRYSFSGKELGSILRQTLPRHVGVREEDVGALKNLRVTERSPSGRVVRLEIETTTNSFVVRGDSIRWVLSPDPRRRRILPSVMFKLEKRIEYDSIAFVSIVGGGNGHGVGMCQNGAIAMAEKGFTYEMILAHYYPGCRIEKVY